MKQYDLNSRAGEMVEAIGGDYIEFTDYEAEIAKYREMLKWCWQFVPDCDLLNDADYAEWEKVAAEL